MWLKRAPIRRTRAVNNRPCLRQLTTKETARLNSINFIALDLNPVPEATGSTAFPDDFERCNELRRWCLSHSGELPRYRSHDKKQTSLARWLQYAKARRDRSINKWPCGRQLTTKETAQLNSILRATVAPPFVGHDATTRKLDMKSSTSNREQTHCKRAAPSTSKRLRQKSTKDEMERACDNRPSGRQLTATETEHLNSILARPQLGQVAATASATITELSRRSRGCPNVDVSPSAVFRCSRGCPNGAR